MIISECIYFYLHSHSRQSLSLSPEKKKKPTNQQWGGGKKIKKKLSFIHAGFLWSNLSKWDLWSPPASGGSVAKAVSVSAAARPGSAPGAECDPGRGTHVTSPCHLPVSPPCVKPPRPPSMSPTPRSTSSPRPAALLPPLPQKSPTAVSGHLFTPELAVEQIEVRVFCAQCKFYYYFF